MAKIMREQRFYASMVSHELRTNKRSQVDRVQSRAKSQRVLEYHKWPRSTRCNGIFRIAPFEKV